MGADLKQNDQNNIDCKSHHGRATNLHRIRRPFGNQYIPNQAINMKPVQFVYDCVDE